MLEQAGRQTLGRLAARRRLLAAVLVLGALVAGRGEAAQFESAPVTTATLAEPYVYEVVASGDGRVSITAPNGLPDWLSLVETGNGTATLSGTPSGGDSGEGIVLRADDTACRLLPQLCWDFQEFDIAIFEQANTPPAAVAPVEDATAVEGQAFSLDVSGVFSDADGDPLVLTVSGLPSSFELADGVIEGTPSAVDTLGSPFEVTLTADDGRGGTADDVFVLTVVPTASADVSLQAIEAAPSPASVDAAVEWTFTLANAGPSTAQSVALAVEFAGNPVTLGEHPCTATVDGGRQRLDCTLGPIASGETESLTVAATASQAGDVFVQAEAAGADNDPDITDNSRSSGLNVGREIAEARAQDLTGYTGTAATEGDLDGDGFADVVMPTSAGEPTAVYLNLEDPASLHPDLTGEGDERRGLSSPPLSLGDTASSTAAALADLDADGALDLVVADDATDAAYRNAGDGTLSLYASFGDSASNTLGVAANDIDGDGFADVVFANDGANALFLNSSGGAFESVVLPNDDASASADVIAVDLLGSGLPDLVFANADGPAVLYENLGGGTFAEPATIETGPAVAVASGDFNGDGRADLVFGRAAAPEASGLPSNLVYLNNGGGNFLAVDELGATATLDVVVADIDEDGAADIVSINATGAHQLYTGNGDGDFSLHPRLLVSPGARSAAVASIGALQSRDIAIAGSDGLDVFFNDGRGNLGLGDTAPPVVELVGEAEVVIEVGSDYDDPGATASDDLDGTLTPVQDGEVDPAVVGTYTVTYRAMDKSGNAAEPATRTVRVEARDADGGGGGAFGGLTLALLVLALGFGRTRLVQ